MPTIAQLNQRHPGCDENRIKDLQALYDGDQLLAARIKDFLHQRPRESNAQYVLRSKEWRYRNYLGPIVDYFASMLFASRPVIQAKKPNADAPELDLGDYYNALREDCDRGGTDIDALFKARLTDAMVGGCSWLRLRSPSTPDGEEPANKLVFDQLKLGDTWLEPVDQLAVYDWDLDDNGHLQWAIIHSQSARRKSLDSGRGDITETWEHLLPDRVDTYQITYEINRRPPDEKTEVAKIASVPHSYGRVPLVCLQLPKSLWIASRLRSPQLAHFRALNALSWSLSTSAYAMSVANVADPEEFVKVTQGAGYGVIIGVDEKWGWAAPPTAHFDSLEKDIATEKDEIYRVAHQMALGVENNAAAVGRSAESKASDAEQTRVALVAFSRAVRETMERVYEMIGRARGDDFEWSVEGLDDFAAVDLAGLVETLAGVQTIGGIPSKTFNELMKTRLAEGLLRDIDEETKATIRQEIKDGTLSPEEEADQALSLEVDRMHALGATLNENGKPSVGAKKPGGNRPPGGAQPKKAFGGGKRGAPPFAKKA
jgi:hypothetical protein